MLHKNYNNAKNSTTFSNYIRNIPIEDDEIMVLFDFKKFLDLANLALTITWYYQQTNDVAMGGTASSAKAKIYMQVHEHTAISTALHPP